MKKLKLSLLAILAGLTMVGCGNSTTTVVYGEDYEVHYLTDALGVGYPDIEYDCGGNFFGFTDAYGAYEFDPADYRCEFLIPADFVEDLYIYDEVGPRDGLNYVCIPSGITGLTGDLGEPGMFDYNPGDNCLIGIY